MSAAAKTASFAALARVLVMALTQLGAQWSGALALMAALTMLVGNIAAVMQTGLKRMLAYSAIAHAGYALLGIAACTADGLCATAAYLTIYLCTKMGAFAIMGYLAVYGQKLGNTPWPTPGKTWTTTRALPRGIRPWLRPCCFFSFFADGHPADGGLYGQIPAL
ncbi:proton-conducting transporter membrane subunit [Desulfovibrio desulfuricans]|uniref:proton-conducting transporter transmembrane domain-containing protein n=1 Tax=Desulfovibrio desulfuricans TaxID=876 RepID=UPI0024941153|nr:proton-conducting transporter membrane subunit [Desulfovibrio desulfuricans]